MCYGSILRILRLPLDTRLDRSDAEDATLLLLRLLGVLTSCGISGTPLLLLSPPLVVQAVFGDAAPTPFCRRRFSTNRRPVMTLVVPPLFVVVVVTVGVPTAFTAVAVVVCSSSAVGSTSISVVALSSCCRRKEREKLIEYPFNYLLYSLLTRSLVCSSSSCPSSSSNSALSASSGYSTSCPLSVGNSMTGRMRRD